MVRCNVCNLFVYSDCLSIVDSLRRETVHETPQVVLSLSKSIKNCGDTDTIQAILDCPSGTGQHPILVGYVFYILFDLILTIC